jgi:hypothetical protein
VLENLGELDDDPVRELLLWAVARRRYFRSRGSEMTQEIKLLFVPP